jgi:hypothetical protein
MQFISSQHSGYGQRIFVLIKQSSEDGRKVWKYVQHLEGFKTNYTSNLVMLNG